MVLALELISRIATLGKLWPLKGRKTPAIAPSAANSNATQCPASRLLLAAPPQEYEEMPCTDLTEPRKMTAHEQRILAHTEQDRLIGAQLNIRA